MRRVLALAAVAVLAATTLGLAPAAAEEPFWETPYGRLSQRAASDDVRDAVEARPPHARVALGVALLWHGERILKTSDLEYPYRVDTALYPDLSPEDIATIAYYREHPFRGPMPGGSGNVFDDMHRVVIHHNGIMLTRVVEELEAYLADESPEAHVVSDYRATPPVVGVITLCVPVRDLPSLSWNPMVGRMGTLDGWGIRVGPSVPPPTGDSPSCAAIDP